MRALKLFSLTFGLVFHVAYAQATEVSSLEKCQKVLRAYCEAFESVSLKEDKIVFQLTTGEEVPCDDGIDYDMMDPLQYAERMNNPDLKSTLQWEYPFGEVEFPITLEDGDPGRIRYEPLLKNIYGSNEGEVKSNLVEISFLGKKVKVNKQQGAADALFAISEELESIEGFKKHFWQSREFSGTFNWRKIAGTDRLSVHSFGAAVDFTIKNDNSKKTYWLWVAECIKPGCEKIEENLKVMPVDEKSLDTFFIDNSGLTAAEVVSVFEKHGYIWGGKWHHFDTMHFEYRPEFLDFNSQPSCELEEHFSNLVTE